MRLTYYYVAVTEEEGEKKRKKGSFLQPTGTKRDLRCSTKRKKRRGENFFLILVLQSTFKDITSICTKSLRIYASKVLSYM